MSARSEFDALKDSLSGLAKQGYISKEEESQEQQEQGFVPPDNLMFAPVRENENVYNHEVQGSPVPPMPNYEEQYAEPTMGYNDGEYPSIDEYDERLWPGGPKKSEVESWKKQFEDIYIADDIDPTAIFIYRTINRYEYKAIIATPNTDPLMREEMICEQCVLFPYEYSYGAMSKGNAGNVSTLADQILMMSGFVKNSMPRRL